MPKVTLTFTLPEEASELRHTQNAGTYASIIYEFSNLLRSKTKYGDGKKVSWEDVRTEWWNLLVSENIDPYTE